jgi:hypothetical protein
MTPRRSREKAFPRLRGWRIWGSAQSSRRGIRVSHSMLPMTLPGPPRPRIFPSRRREALDRRPSVRSPLQPDRLTTHRSSPGEGSGRASDSRRAGLRARDPRGASSVPARSPGLPLAPVGARAGGPGPIALPAERSHPALRQSAERLGVTRRGAVSGEAIDRSRSIGDPGPAPRLDSGPEIVGWARPAILGLGRCASPTKWLDLLIQPVMVGGAHSTKTATCACPTRGLLEPLAETVEPHRERFSRSLDRAGRALRLGRPQIDRHVAQRDRAGIRWCDLRTGPGGSQIIKKIDVNFVSFSNDESRAGEAALVVGGG